MVQVLNSLAYSRLPAPGSSNRVVLGAYPPSGVGAQRRGGCSEPEPCRSARMRRHYSGLHRPRCAGAPSWPTPPLSRPSPSGRG